MIRLAPALLLLAGCAAAPPPARVAIHVSIDGGGCAALVEGRRYPITPVTGPLRAHLASLKARRVQVALTAPPEAPYRCLGELLYEAQRARLDLSFGLALAPPPPR